VKAAIRKQIGKNEGDWVHVILYSEELPAVTPDDFTLCLQDEPKAHGRFKQLSAGEQKELVDWIYTAPRDDTKVERMAQAIDKLLNQFKG